MILFYKEKSNEIRGKSNGFIWIWDGYCSFLIISHSYHFICKGQINRKELFVFGAYTLLTEIVFDFPLYILYLDGLGIERFLFPLGLYSYFRWMKQYERDRGLFLSLLLSLLYESTHNFLSVTFSSITGDNFVLQYHFPFFFVVTVLTYFVTLKIIYYFHLELAYFDEDYLYPFLKKVFLLYYCYILYLSFQIW